MTEHPHDDLAAFALGALDEPERRTVAAHVDTCAACAREVEGYRVSLHTYASAADADAPDLRARIVARERGASPRRDNAWVGWLRRPTPMFVPLAVALLLIASIVGLAQARREADGYAAALAAIPGARVVSLDPSVAGSDLRGALVIPTAGQPYLLLRVPAPPSGRAWEAWVLHGDTPLPAGVTVAGGVVTIALTAPFGSGDGAAVTLEQAGGSSAPTTAPVLAIPRT